MTVVPLSDLIHIVTIPNQMPVRGPERMYASQWRLIDTIYVRVRERALHKQLITYENE